jgi:DNA polymerase-3 subunit epsilon
MLTRSSLYRTYTRCFHSSLRTLSDQHFIRRPRYEIVVVDVETTNRSPELGRIIEVAASRIVDGHTVEQYMGLINPQVKIPQETIEITKISNELASKGQSAKQIMHKFADFIGDSTLVAHNASFDLKFIAAEMRRNDVPLARGLHYAFEQSDNIRPVFEVSKIIGTTNVNVAKQQFIPHLCTLMLARRLYPDAPSHKLGEIATFLFKTEFTNLHRAGNDVMLTKRLWHSMYEEASKRLGFSPSLDFFEKLSEIKAKDVDQFIIQYAKKNKLL